MSGKLTAKTMNRYYVYTPSDGNEDGLLTGYTLEDAKRVACRHSEELRRDGRDSSAYVLDSDTHNFVWGTGSEKQ